MDTISERSHKSTTGDKNTASFSPAVMNAAEPANEGRLELQIRLPAGIKLRVKLREDATVAELKIVIEKCSGIPSDLHSLCYQNNKLNDETRIGDITKPNGDHEILALSVPNWWNKLVCCSMKGEIEQTCARVTVKMNQITREERQFVAVFIGASRGNHSLLFNLTAGKKPLSIHQTVKHSGRSLLHAAVAGGDLSCVVNILVNGGVCLIQQPDKNGETPFSDAKKLHNEGIEQLLEKYLEMHRQENKKLEESRVFDLESEDSDGLEVVIPRNLSQQDSEKPENRENSSAVSTAEFSKNKIANVMKTKWKMRKRNNVSCDVEQTLTNSPEAKMIDKNQEQFDSDSGNSVPEHTQSPSEVYYSEKESGEATTTQTESKLSIDNEVAKEPEFFRNVDYTEKQLQPKTNKFDVNIGENESVERYSGVYLGISSELRSRSGSEPHDFKPDDKQTITAHYQVDNKSKNNNKAIDKVATTLTNKDSPNAHASQSECSPEVERLKLNRECLPLPTLSPESAENKVSPFSQSEEHEVILESVIELNEKERLPKHAGIALYSGEKASTDFPPLCEHHQPNSHDVISLKQDTPVRAKSATYRSRLPGKNTGQKEIGRVCLHEKLVRSHSGPRRALNLRTTRDSWGANQDSVPAPHPPVRETKSDALPHGKYAGKRDGYKLTQKDSSPDHLFHLVPHFGVHQPNSAPNSPQRQRRNRTGSLPVSPSSPTTSRRGGETRTNRTESLHAGAEKHHGLLMDSEVHSYLLSKYKARREKLPWNQWRAVEHYDDNNGSSSGESEEDHDQNGDGKHHPGSAAGKGFKEWLAEKEAEFHKHRIKLEEEAKKAEEMKKAEKKFRKLTHLTHEEWLEEKLIKEKEISERNLELTRHPSDAEKKERQKKAERKFEEWLLQKADEELKEEEKLRKEMEKKFEELKRKKELTPSAVSRVKLCRTSSLPLDRKRPVKHSAASVRNAHAQNVN